MEGRQINLLFAVATPQLGIGLIDHSAIGNDPLAVERSIAVAHRRQTIAFFVGDRLWIVGITRQPLDNLVDVLVAGLTASHVRMKQLRLLFGFCANQFPPPQT